MTSTEKNNKTRVMIIGLDGATFDILTPLIDQGKLPNLQYLIQNGTSGKLRSTQPPLSPAAWSTFQTGKNPGKHGVFDFFRNAAGEHGHVPVNSTLLKSNTLWEILSGYGKKVGALNIMFNYPPRKVNGFIVSGKETPDESSEYTFPPSLKEEILKVEPKYEADPFKRVSRTRNFLKDVPVRLNRQEKVNAYLYEKYSPDFFTNLFAIPDVIQHLFWKYMDPSHPHYSERESRKFLPLIENCFITLDDIIGRRLKLIDDNTVVIVMSDHGGGPLNKFIQLNRWLEQNGFLFLKKEMVRNESSLKAGIKKLLKKVFNFALMYDEFGLLKKIKFRNMGKRMDSIHNAIDWTRTKAFAGRISEHGIYCNLKGREKEGIVNPGEEYETLRQSIISKLSDLTDPANGQKIFESVHTREEVYNGPYVPNAPDISLRFGESFYEPGDALFGDSVFEDVRADGLSGMHRPDGILIAYGSEIKKSSKIQGAEICDLAATVLYAMGLEIPDDMDSKVLLDLFSESFVDKNKVLYKRSETEKSQEDDSEMVYSGDETEEIEKRLKSLGYL